MMKSWLLYFLSLAILLLLVVVTEEFILLSLIALVFILPLLAIGFHQLIPKSLMVEVNMEAQGEKFKTVKGEVIFNNQSYIPWGRVQAILKSENLLTGEKASLQIYSPLTLKGEKVIPVKFKSHHGGQIQFKVEDLKIYDLFCLSYRRGSHEARKKTLILPKFYQSNPMLMSKAHGEEDQFMSEYDEQLKGGDYSEVFQYKAYEKGDSLQRMNWKLSGKLGELIVKVGSKPVPRSILLILDTSVATADPPSSAKKRDSMMETFLAVSQGLLLNNQPHGVGFYHHGDGEFVHTLLEYDDQLSTFLPRLLSAGECLEKKSSLAHYQDYQENLSYDHIIFVTPSLPKSHEHRGGKLSILLICDEPMETTENEKSKVHPINMEDLEYSLASLEL